MLDSDLVPSDVEAERHVVGACLLAPDMIAQIMTMVEMRDFYYIPHMWVYSAIAQMSVAGQPITVDTVVRKIGEMKAPNGKSCLDEAGGPPAIASIIEGVLPDDVSFWAERIRKKRTERDLLAFAEKAKKVAMSNPEDIIEQLTKLESQLLKVSHADGERNVYTLQDAADKTSDRIERYINEPDAITGLATGWGVFDRQLDGLSPGEVTIVYAPTSRYKSFFTANIGWAFARQGIPGLWFTTEMSHDRVYERLLQLEAAVNLRWLRRDGKIGDARDHIKRSQRSLGEYPVYICDDSPLDISYVHAEIARQRRWHNIEYVIIDLIDHVSSKRFEDNEITNQSQVMKQIKAMAKRFGIHIILVSHISKAERTLRGRAELDVDDMKGSSSKGQDVDNAISLMPVRWDSENGKWVALTREQIGYRAHNIGVMTVLVALTKVRNGETGSIPFKIDLVRGGRMFPDLDARQEELPNGD